MNTQITEDYVSFETARLLKEKGFEGDTSCYYVPDSSICWHYQHYQDFDKKDRIECPTLQMAMKWLRKVHGLIISIEFQIICPTWKWRIYIKSSNDKHTNFQHYDKYEEACEAAIEYCLINLI